jgi:hypothetical protein
MGIGGAESAAPWVGPRTEEIRQFVLPPGAPWVLERGWGVSPQAVHGASRPVNSESPAPPRLRIEPSYTAFLFLLV